MIGNIQLVTIVEPQIYLMQKEADLAIGLARYMGLYELTLRYKNPDRLTHAIRDVQVDRLPNHTTGMLAIIIIHRTPRSSPQV